MRGVIDHAGEIGDGHADERRDDEPRRGVIYSEGWSPTPSGQNSG